MFIRKKTETSTENVMVAVVLLNKNERLKKRQNRIIQILTHVSNSAHSPSYRLSLRDLNSKTQVRNADVS